jgi:hypothetical protein
LLKNRSIYTFFNSQNLASKNSRQAQYVDHTLTPVKMTSLGQVLAHVTAHLCQVIITYKNHPKTHKAHFLTCGKKKITPE